MFLFSQKPRVRRTSLVQIKAMLNRAVALSPCKPGLTLSGHFFSILNLKILFFFPVEDLSSIKE